MRPRLLLALMFASSLGLWIGVPLLWLFVAGRVQGATGSLGAAVAVALAGVVVSVLAAVRALSWLAHRHAAARAARGLEDYGWAPLEGVLVTSTVIALAAFGVWFFFFSGAEPLPLGLPK
jgi:uncharacterized membrane protein YbhN (UPF0104 family)